MAACMAANGDKSDPAAYCASMEQAEKSYAAAQRFRITKTDPDRQLVFGWANVSMRKSGETIVDHHDEMIAPAELEQAAYAYNLEFRDADEMHTAAVKGRLVESFVATPDKLEAMGLKKDALPVGWWVGFHVDADTFAKVKDGKLAMFSIAGEAQPVAA